MIVKTFEEFLENFGRKVSEMDNLPSGVQDPGDSSEFDEILDPEINIDPSKHKMKLVMADGVPSTDFSELAVLKGDDGSIYVLQFDASDEQYDAYKNRAIVGYDYDEEGNKEPEYEYLDLDQMGVQAIANDVPFNERGEGMKDMSRKDLVKLDGESAESFLKELEGIVNTVDPSIKKPYMAMQKIVADFIG